MARGLLRPGRAYADAVKLFEPYDRIRDPQPEVRVDLLRLIAEVMRRHMEALILVNNRLEGNAPGTIRAGERTDLTAAAGCLRAFRTSARVSPCKFRSTAQSAQLA